jgi:hypothetical protein
MFISLKQSHSERVSLRQLCFLFKIFIMLFYGRINELFPIIVKKKIIAAHGEKVIFLL